MIDVAVHTCRHLVNSRWNLIQNLRQRRHRQSRGDQRLVLPHPVAFALITSVLALQLKKHFQKRLSPDGDVCCGKEGKDFRQRSVEIESESPLPAALRWQAFESGDKLD